MHSLLPVHIFPAHDSAVHDCICPTRYLRVLPPHSSHIFSYINYIPQNRSGTHEPNTGIKKYILFLPHTGGGNAGTVRHYIFPVTRRIHSRRGTFGLWEIHTALLIAGLMRAESGEILLNGTPLTENSSRIGYMLQHDYLFEWRTVYRNIILGAEINGTLDEKTKEKAAELLEQYGLAQFARSKPSELSGGMRQRAALIRTLLLDPELLLLDEPFSALDYQTRLNVSDDIGQIIRNSGKTALLVTHDLSEAVSLADRIIILSARPATISDILPVSFSLEKDTPLGRRNAPEFKNYFNKIWKELNQYE